MIRIIVVCLFALCLATSSLAGTTTSLVYQGELTQGGAPANGSFDFRFDLHTTAAGGGGPISTEFADVVSVSDGVFTSELTFSQDFNNFQSLWLEVSVRPAGGGAYTALSPRQALMPTPFANTALGTAANSVDSNSIEQNSILSGDVRSDHIQLRVDSQCAAGSAIRVISEQGAVTCQPVGGGSGDAWLLTGNSGTSQGSDYIGNSDDVALDFRVNNQRAMRYEWGFSGTGSPNLIGGNANNSIPDSEEASVIAGGGVTAAPNTISSSYAFIGGGISNQVTANYGSVLGGRSNVVSGSDGIALGRGAQALHDNSFVFNDGGTFASTGDDQFLIDASGGVGIGTNDPSDFLHLSAPNTANAMRIQIAGTTRFRVFSNGGVTVGVNSSPPSAGLLVQGELRTNTPVTRYLQIGPSDWEVYNETIDHYRTSLVFVVNQSSGAFNEAFAPVHLPQGAVVTELRVAMKDNQATGNIQIRLARKENLAGNAGNTMATVNTNGVNSAIQIQTDSSIDFATVDNETYHYYLSFESGTPNGAQEVLGARITYTTTSVVD